jgi:hypothetical protein
MSDKSREQTQKIKRRIEAIGHRITTMGNVAQGTVTKRTKVCGKSNCRCAHDPAARHGPYYEWTRREKGRYLHSVISPQQAEELLTAIDNHKRVLALLARWSGETARILGIKTSQK